MVPKPSEHMENTSRHGVPIRAPPLLHSRHFGEPFAVFLLGNLALDIPLQPEQSDVALQPRPDKRWMIHDREGAKSRSRGQSRACHPEPSGLLGMHLDSCLIAPCAIILAVWFIRTCVNCGSVIRRISASHSTIAGYQERRRDTSDRTAAGRRSFKRPWLPACPPWSTGPLPSQYDIQVRLVLPCGPKMRPWEVTAYCRCGR